MSRFRNKERETPAVSTASLPDIVFMLLFFFMIIAQPRDKEILVDQKLPKATQLQKLEQKSLVRNFWVGKPKNIGKFGREARIQADDVILTSDEEILRLVAEYKGSLGAQAGKMTISLKADEKVKMKVLTDIKEKLREADARKINYSTVKSSK